MRRRRKERGKRDLPGSIRKASDMIAARTLRPTRKVTAVAMETISLID